MTSTPAAAPEKAPKPRLVLPADTQFAIVGPEVLTEHARKYPGRGSGRKPAERTKEQKIIDTLVKQAHDAWVKAGKPKDFVKSPGGSIAVPAEQVDLVVSAIRKAGVLHKVSVRFGSMPDLTDMKPDDAAVVVFKVGDARPRKSAAK